MAEFLSIHTAYWGGLVFAFGLIIGATVRCNKSHKETREQVNKENDKIKEDMNGLGSRVTRMEVKCESCHVDSVERCLVELKTRLGVLETNQANTDKTLTASLIDIKASIGKLEGLISDYFRRNNGGLAG